MTSIGPGPIYIFFVIYLLLGAILSVLIGLASIKGFITKDNYIFKMNSYLGVSYSIIFLIALFMVLIAEEPGQFNPGSIKELPFMILYFIPSVIGVFNYLYYRYYNTSSVN